MLCQSHLIYNLIMRQNNRGTPPAGPLKAVVMVSYEEFAPTIPSSLASGYSVNTIEHPHQSQSSSHASIASINLPSCPITRLPSSSVLVEQQSFDHHFSNLSVASNTMTGSTPATNTSRSTNSFRAGNLKRSPLSRSRSGGIFSNPFRR